MNTLSVESDVYQQFHNVVRVDVLAPINYLLYAVPLTDV